MTDVWLFHSRQKTLPILNQKKNCRQLGIMKHISCEENFTIISGTLQRVEEIVVRRNNESESENSASRKLSKCTREYSLESHNSVKDVPCIP